MIAVADRLTFLTAELAAATRDHLFAHLERCDPAYPVLLTLANADAIGHDMETVPTKAMQAAGELGTDDEIVAAAAERHGDVLAEARVRFPKLRLLVLCACPVLRPSQAPLVRRDQRGFGPALCGFGDPLRRRSRRPRRPGDGPMTSENTERRLMLYSIRIDETRVPEELRSQEMIGLV